MDLEAIRTRLAEAGNSQYWRCLEELAGDERFRTLVRQRVYLPESPSQDPLSRRRFLAILGASLGLAGLSGCAFQPPAEMIVPYVRAPEGLSPGSPQFYATAMTLRGEALGLLVESHEGRPTKIEGNQQHPASLGATDVFAQAAVLGLYDPDRSQTVLYRGRIQSWDDAAAALRQALETQRQRQGAGLRLLTETVASPTLAEQIRTLLAQYPQARWHQYDPAGRDGARLGARWAFGRDVNTFYRFERAERILSLDADFLAAGPGHVRYARDFLARRRVPHRASQAAPGTRNRLYMVQCTPTLTGAKADHCWPLRASDIERLARVVAAKLDRQLAPLVRPGSSPLPERTVDEIVHDLRDHARTSLVLAGEEQPPAVHALAHAMNGALENEGETVMHTDPVEARPEDQIASLRQLAEDLEQGRVEMLVILGGNPAFTAPRDLRFGERLLAADRSGPAKVPLRVHLSAYEDETSARCDWHLPEAHFLESWSDTRAYEGTASIVQPLIAPLYAGKSAHELLALLTDQSQRSGYALVRDYWRRDWETRQPASEKDKTEREEAFEPFWRTALHDGILADTTFSPSSVSLQPDWAKQLPTASGMELPSAPAETGAALEIVFRPDPTLLDGRFANNGWLQELPKPLTRLTWDNALLMSPALAERLGVTCQPSGHGGEHGETTVDTVELEYRGTTLEVPAWPLPGQPEGCVTLHLGHGRTLAGHVGNGVGVNAYLLRTSTAPWSDRGLDIRRTGRRVPLACTQYHQLMEGRDLVRSGTWADYQRDPQSLAVRSPETPPSLYPEGEHQYEEYKWGMAIDLTACLGCGACVVACQAENNIPVVGKEQVLRGREMHWLRIDRYYAGSAENPQTHFQPVPCMQCENAPCELVCPVGATVHSAEGLNDMVYNRCVGTRYCSNNCPYKVRRFNFLQYADFDTPALQPQRNPEVTVRSRGVMEKCTYCVQRITRARIQADKQDRRIRDGEVVTACQAACPAAAIVFGDLNDPQAEVNRWKSSPLNYGLLEELNTRPRTTYLASLKNPNERITT